MLNLTRTSADALWSMLRGFSPAAWLLAGIGTVGALAAIGLPTRLIANGIFGRMTPTRMQDYVIWAITAPLVGLIIGSFALGRAVETGDGKLLSGGLFSFLAVGCPVCNKVVVLLIGTSGALTFWAPLQLWVGVASVLTLAWTLVLRARGVAFGCVLPAPEGIAAPPGSA